MADRTGCNVADFTYKLRCIINPLSELFTDFHNGYKDINKFTKFA